MVWKRSKTPLLNIKMAPNNKVEAVWRPSGKQCCCFSKETSHRQAVCCLIFNCHRHFSKEISFDFFTEMARAVMYMKIQMCSHKDFGLIVSLLHFVEARIPIKGICLNIFCYCSENLLPGPLKCLGSNTQLVQIVRFT